MCNPALIGSGGGFATGSCPLAGTVLPPAIDAASTLAVVPGVGEPPTVIVSRNRRREDYESAVEAAAATVTAHHQETAPTAASARAADLLASGAPSHGVQRDYQRQGDGLPSSRVGDHVLSPGHQLLSWPGSYAVKGGPGRHFYFLLTLLFFNVFAVLLPVLAHHQIRAAGADNTSQGRRALIWCRIYGGLSLVSWLLPYTLLE